MKPTKMAMFVAAFAGGLLGSIGFAAFTAKSRVVPAKDARLSAGPADRREMGESRRPLSSRLPSVFLSAEQWETYIGGLPIESRVRLSAETERSYWMKAEAAHSWIFRAFAGDADRTGEERILRQAGIIQENGQLPAGTSDFLLGWAYAGGFRQMEKGQIPGGDIPKEQWPVLWEMRGLLGASKTLEEDLGVIAGLSGISDAERFECKHACVTGWCLRDPVAVLRWSQLDRENSWDMPADQALLAAAAMGQRRFKEVMRSVGASVDEIALAKAWVAMERPPAEVLAFVKTLEPKRRSAFLGRFIQELRESSLFTISRFIAEAPDELLNLEFVRGLGSEVLSRNPEEFTNLSRALTTEERNEALDECIYHTFSNEAAAGRYYVAHRTIAGAPLDRLEIAVGQIAYKDLSEALALPFVQDGKSPELLKAAYRLNLSKMEGTPEQIVSFLDTLPGQMREQLLRDSVARFSPNMAAKILDQANAGDEAWLAFLDNARLPSDEMAELLRQRIAKGVTPELSASAVGKLVGTLTREDDAAALAALQTFPALAAHDAGTIAYVEKLGQIDALRAVDFVEALPPGPVRDACIEKLQPALGFSTELTQRVAKLTITNPAARATNP